MKIVSWNVNGLRAVAKKGLADILRDMKADIACFQETKITNDKLTPDLRTINGYKSYWSFSERAGYSGVVNYCLDEPRAIKTEFSVDRLETEGRLIINEYELYVVANAYFPNGKQGQERIDYKLKFYDVFLREMDKYRSEGKGVIFCGDVNTAHSEIDLARPKENAKISGFLPEERQWLDEFESRGYIDIFRQLHPETVQYSWWDMKTRARERNVGWRIDYFFVSDDLVDSVKSVEILDKVMGSDHCPITLDIDVA